MIIFETERLIVRRYASDDKENFFLMNGDEEMVRYIRPAKSREESDRFLQDVLRYSEENPLFGRWAVYERETGNFAGTFAIIPVDGTDKLQLGYSLLKIYRGRGYATELTKTGISYFFNKTSLNEIYALTELPNIGSQKVLLKCGFIHLGNRKEKEREIMEFICKRDQPFPG